MEILFAIIALAACAFLLWFVFRLEQECRASRPRGRMVEQFPSNRNVIVLPETTQRLHARTGGSRG